MTDRSDYAIVVAGGWFGAHNVGYGSYGILDNRTGDRHMEHKVFPEAKANQAYYLALVAALEDLLHSLEKAGRPAGQCSVEVRCHNELIIRQLTGEWRVKAGSLARVYGEVCALLRRFESVTAMVQSREDSETILGSLAVGTYSALLADLGIERAKSPKRRARRRPKPDEIVDVQMKDLDYVIIFDGGKHGDRGPAYGSYVLIRTSDGHQKSNHVEFGTDVTSQIAEYKALIAALNDLIDTLHAAGESPSEKAVEVRGDNRSVLYQLAKKHKATTIPIMEVRDEALALLCQFRRYITKRQSREKIQEVIGH